MDAIAAVVMGALVVALAGGWALLRRIEQRERTRQIAREAACPRHEWEPIVEHDELIPKYREWCRRCGARR